MLCKLCGLEKPHIEAHIVAKCLLKPLFSNAGLLRSISKDVSAHPKRLPTGVYDTNILCADCDSSFGPWEEYTAGLLFDEAPKYRRLARNGFYSIPKYEYATLKLCVLSILWRMSITGQQEYRTVSLGQKYENDIRAMLLAKEPGASDVFSIGWLQLTDYIGSRVAFGTSPARFNNTTLYNLGLPGFVVVVKVGQHHQPHPFQPVIVTPGRPLIFGLKEHRLEDDWKPAFQKIWQKQQSKRRRPPRT
jgi:hypothetical protein